MPHLYAIAFAVGALFAGVTVLWMAHAASKRRIAEAVERARAAEREARSVERLAELGSMTAGLAHEIKNPLSTITLNAQLLREAIHDLPADDAERARLARRCDGLTREAERLTGILTDFLEYAGELKLDPRAADLNALVEELGDFYLPQAEQHGVRLRVETARVPVEAVVDVPHLKQAVLNLMINAVQAMTAAGDPTTGRARTPGNELILRVLGPRADHGATPPTIHVIDTGPGIPEHARDKIFHPYFSTKAGGTGLGLPTTRRIIEAHAGRLELFTEKGKGTDFAVILPQQEPVVPLSGEAG